MSGGGALVRLFLVRVGDQKTPTTMAPTKASAAQKAAMFSFGTMWIFAKRFTKHLPGEDRDTI